MSPDSAQDDSEWQATLYDNADSGICQAFANRVAGQLDAIMGRIQVTHRVIVGVARVTEPEHFLDVLLDLRQTVRDHVGGCRHLPLERSPQSVGIKDHNGRGGNKDRDERGKHHEEGELPANRIVANGEVHYEEVTKPHRRAS